jgi:hypothetical protein
VELRRRKRTKETLRQSQRQADELETCAEWKGVARESFAPAVERRRASSARRMGGGKKDGRQNGYKWRG